MKLRIVSAIGGLCLIVPMIVLGGSWFAWFTYAMGAIGLYELARMKKIAYFNEIGLIATVSLGFVLIPSRYWLFIIPNFNPEFIFYILAMVMLTLTVYRQEKFNVEDAALLMFGALYVGYGFRYLIELRDKGLLTIGFLFLVVWATDIGAYCIGRLFGKHKLAPAVSPNKTIEGSLGGVVLAVVSSIGYVWLLNPDLAGVERYVWLAIFLSLAGQVGDLVESAYKRHFGVKDSGNILPGHGGILDRFDSTLFSAFMFMIFLNLMK